MTDITANGNIKVADRQHIDLGAVIILLSVMSIWAVGVMLLGAKGVFVAAPGEAPIAIIAGVALPPLLFLLAYAASVSLRRLIASLDLGLIVALQGWRVVGAMFLALWAYGMLPAAFAAPAGIGDVAVGLAAPFVAVAVWMKATHWRKASFGLIAAGMADFAGALGTGVLTDEGGLLYAPGGPTSALLNSPPLSLFPTFIVPAFIILHLIAFIKTIRE